MSICKVEGCERSRHARGMCKMHYLRWRRGSEIGGAERRPPGVPKKNVGKCSVGGCEKEQQYAAMCSMHYSRLRRHGDVHYENRTPNVGECSVDGCSRPMRKLSYCAAHYSMHYREGDIREWKYSWAEFVPECIECGRANGSHKSRVYCSSACAVRARRAGAPRPESSDCIRCSTPVDLGRTPSGRFKRIDTALCVRCRTERKYAMNVREIALRDGTDCGICGEMVDMDLRRPDSLLGPSVDHIIPVSRGGSEEESNLQLAHYWCNAVKSNREGFVIN